jgi:signal transduction histidine kinase/CheY-like chemotaxis protein
VSERGADKPGFETKARHWLLRSLVLAAVYFASARLGLALQFQDTQATPIWPPSGIALAAVLLFGPRISGGVFLGAFLANLIDFYLKARAHGPVVPPDLFRHMASHPHQVTVSAMIGAGNMLEAIAGAAFIRRYVPRLDLAEKIRGVLLFALATFLCCLIASTMGTVSFALASLVPPVLAPTMWFTWWLGDVAGILAFTPLLLVWSQLSFGEWRREPWLGIVASLLLVYVLGQILFDGWLDREMTMVSRDVFHGWLNLKWFKAEAYIILPALLWCEVRFGRPVGTLAIAIVSLIALFGTLHGLGPFIGDSQNEALLVLQGFVAIVALTLAVLGAALTERRRAFEELTQARALLERRVDERTVDLHRANEALSLQVRERNDALARLEKEIVERQRAEEILRQSQKIEAVGQLTGGIAHDFNNLLTIIMGQLDLLLRRLDKTSVGARDSAEAAMRGATRAAALVQRLLTFSRRQPLNPTNVDANELVSGMDDLVRRSIGEAIICEMALAADLAPCHCDFNQLESALLNIVLNARDAMPQGGRLTITTANVALAGAEAEQAGLDPGAYVMLAVSDEGHGMTPEIRNRAFEPFFTTKEVGKGSGLGLSMVYGFVKQSQGGVRIETEHAPGTTVKLYLPRYAEPAIANEPAPAPAAPARPSPRLVLVVEDDDAVRQYSMAALEVLGYRVMGAADGAAALDLRSSEPDIELLFTDIGLPGRDGPRLVEEARRLRPELKVLFTTGYDRFSGNVAPGGDPILAKPFTTDALAREIDRVLSPAFERRSAPV